MCEILFLFSSQRATRDTVIHLPGLPVPYVGVENEAYTRHDSDDDEYENGETILRSYL